MITRIEAAKRFKADHGWLQTYHLFSFADYHDPQNIHWGNLRVFNDDTIAGKSGFGEHSHDNMEIVTIVFEGALTHQDSMGNTGVIRKGEVQYMSAGTGVTHAEMNEGEDPVHLYQIWLLPKQRDLKPQYGQKDFSTVASKNMLLPVASGQDQGEALKMQADATIYTGELKEGESLEHSVQPEQGVFLYVRSGSLEVNGTALDVGDQARIFEEDRIGITALKDSRFVLIDTDMGE